MGRGPEQTFSQEEIQVGSMNIKRCSTSPIISETKIKTIIRYHLTPVRMDIIRNTSNKYWQECEEKVTLMFYYWEYKLVQPQWETVLRFFRKTKNRTTVCVCSVVSESFRSHGLQPNDPTGLHSPMIPLGSSVHGIFQARILEQIATSYSKQSS